MKTFTVRRDEVSEGISVYKAENNDYYIRLSSSSYPANIVRKYLSRNSPPEIENDIVYDLDYYYDLKLRRTFLCKAVIPNNKSVIVLMKHHHVDKLKGKFVIYQERGLPYMLIILPVNHEVLFTSRDEEKDVTLHYKMYLDRKLNLHSNHILK